MTRLEIKVQQPSAAGSLQSAAMAKVRRFTDAEGAKAGPWQEVKPVGIAGQDQDSIGFTSFDLPGGGSYEVTITLPRGQDIGQDYEIQEGDTRQEIIPMDATPQAGLGWQQYAGIVRSSLPVRELPMTSGAEPPESVHHEGSMREPQESKPERPRSFGLGPAGSVHHEGMQFDEDEQDEQDEMAQDDAIAEGLNDDETGDFGLKGFRTGGSKSRSDFRIGKYERREFSKPADDDLLAMFRTIIPGDDDLARRSILRPWPPSRLVKIKTWLPEKEWFGVRLLHEHEAKGDDYKVWSPEMPDSMRAGGLVHYLKWMKGEPDPGFPRWSLYDPTRKEVFLASIPWAWWGSKDPEGDSIHIVYDGVDPESVGDRQQGRLIVSVQDKYWFGLLEFLGSGRLIQAGGMIEEVLGGDFLKEALEDKIHRPLVAVAGAIILIARTQSAKRQYWDEWLENLANWFEGIPDSSILLGCRRAMQAENATERRSAYDHIQTGVRQGIPFFSASIRMMNLTLAQLGNDIPEADALRREIAPLCSAVDPAQPFTVLNF